MSGHWRRQLSSLGLLVVVLVAAAALLPLLGAPAMLLQAGGWVAAGMLLFLGLQFLIFRVFDLRSRADERRTPGDDPDGESPDPPGDDTDWRAWRG
jgi:hypothetical protein